MMVGGSLLLVATSAAAPIGCDPTHPSEAASVVDETAPQLGFQIRLGYEATWLRLSRMGFGGRVSGFEHDQESYEVDVSRPNFVAHGVVLRPNFIYQPGDVPLQLTVGFHFGFGLGAIGDYAGTTEQGLAVSPDPDQPAVALRAALPVGLRLDLGGPALRATLAPGVGLVAIDERLTGAGSDREGTATGVSELVRGEFGLEVPVADTFGFTLDAGYDFGLGGGWFLGSGLVLTFEPYAATSAEPAVPSSGPVAPPRRSRAE